MISNSGHDENGRYSGGKAGDQTGNEWAIIKWYNRPWTCVLRHNEADVREKLAELSEKAAKNNNIGYDQLQRETYWEQLKNAGYDPSKIKKKCEADCSAGVTSNVKAVGYLLGIKKLQGVVITSTHYMKEILRKAGFEVLTEKKYLTSDKYLLRGDILLNEGHHTAVNLTNGTLSGKKEKKEDTKADAAKSFEKSIAGTYKVNTSTGSLALRAGAGTDKKKLCSIPKGASVRCYGYYTDKSDMRWLLVEYEETQGFASGKYLKKK